MKADIPPPTARRLRSLAHVLDASPAEVLALVLETGLAAVDSPDGPLMDWARERGGEAGIRAAVV